MKSIVLGGGCFWCLEAVYQEVRGVMSVTPGYAGGDVKDPTYEMVTTGTTKHAEVVRVEYDEDIIALPQILDVFWTIHDPTTPDQQGADIGTQYRSIILYGTKEDETEVLESIERVRPLWGAAIVTETDYLKSFYPAEEYHHNYFQKFPETGYCQAVINPKLTKLRAELPGLIRPKA